MTEKNKRSQSLYVEDMIAAIGKVLAYTKDLDFAGFESDELVKDAVLLNLQIVGEAANHISEEIQEKYPNIPWRDMADFRIIVVHIYLSVDMAKVWGIDFNTFAN